MNTDLGRARPVGRSLTPRAMAVLASAGSLGDAAETVRAELRRVCGPTLVGHVFVSCWPPILAPHRVATVTADPDWQARMHDLLAAHPSAFMVVGTCQQLWGQISPELS